MSRATKTREELLDAVRQGDGKGVGAFYKTYPGLREQVEDILRTRTEKKCGRCGEVKPIESFRTNGNPRAKDGRHGHCGDCANRAAADWRRDNPERVKKTQHRNHRQPSVRWSCGAYQAAKRGLSWTLTKAEHAALLLLPCHYCGGPLPETWTGLDRLDSERGYEPDNVVPCCKPCNMAKSDYWTPAEMLIIGAVMGRLKVERKGPRGRLTAPEQEKKGV